MLLADILLIH